MKKTRKNILGVFGLAAVVAMTVFAAFLPAPKTQAKTSTVTDTIVVRVVAPTTNVTITSPRNGTVFNGPIQTVDYDYEKTVRVTIILEYIDDDGTTHRYEVESIDTPDGTGSNSTNINFDDYGHGYGKYIIKVIGEGDDGLPHERSVTVFYSPLAADVEENKNNGDADITLDYDDKSEDLKKIEINVYDKDGNLVEELSPIYVDVPGKNATIPFSGTDLPGGKYIIRITPLDADGNVLNEPFDLEFIYRPKEVVPVPDAGTPDTGGFFVGLNISRSDYLITGIIIFLVFGIFGIVFVAKGRGNQAKK